MRARGRWWRLGASAAAVGSLALPAVVTSPVSAAEAEHATISGTVTDRATGEPLTGICVQVRGAGDADGATVADGTYSVTVRPQSTAGDAAPVVTVRFFDCARRWYAPQFFDDNPDGWEAVELPIGAGEQHTGIDAAMDVGGTLSGTVTHGGAPVSGICVVADGRVGQPLDGVAAVVGGDVQVTGPDGTWRATGLNAGNYTVHFHDCRPQRELIDEWYRRSTNPQNATRVAVALGAETSGIDADLVRGGAIEGRVTDQDGSPVAGLCVAATWFSTRTDGDGRYRIGGLPSGLYEVRFASCGSDTTYRAEYWDDDPFTPTSIQVAVPETVTGIDAVLDWTTTLRGTVRGPDGRGLGRACVAAHDDDGEIVFTRTAPDGTWSLVAGSGTFRVQVADCEARVYPTRWYEDARTEDAATPIDVPRGGIVDGIDVRLPEGGSITGRITDAAGQPAHGACAIVTSGPGGGSARTGPDGTYVITGLATGEYTVAFSGCDAGTSVWEWYDDAFEPADAMPIAVTEGAATTGIDAAITFTGTVHGRVRDRLGRGLAGICVKAVGVTTMHHTQTDATGRYVLDRVPPGSYAIEFSDCLARHGVLTEWWNDAITQAAATPVVVAERQIVGGIDAVLAVGATLTGRVVGGDGMPAGGVCAEVRGPAPAAATRRVVTVGDGTWSATALHPGRYAIAYSSCGSEILSEWQTDAADEADADLVDLTEGATVAVSAQVSPGESVGPFVLAGIRNVTIGAGTVVTSGEVGTHTRRRDGEPEVVLGEGATVSQRVIGDTVEGGGAVVGDLRSNDGTVARPVVVRTSGFAPVPLLHLPTLRTATPGTNDVHVVLGVTNLSPGSYRDLHVGAGGVLQLTGGRYDVRRVTIAPGGRLVFRAHSQLRVAERIVLGAGGEIGPGLTGLDARLFRIDVAGADGSPTTPAFDVGDGGSVNATVHVPRGTFRAGDSVDLVGGYVANAIDVGAGARVRWWSGFTDSLE